jgi:hypothetical protein
MILATATVQASLLDPSLLSLFGDCFANFLRSIAVSTDTTAEIFVVRGSGEQGPSSLVIDRLHAKVLKRSLNAQSWTFRSTAYNFSHTKLAALSLIVNYFLEFHRAPAAISIAYEKKYFD